MLKLICLAFLAGVALSAELESLHYYERSDEVRQGMLGTFLDGNSDSREGVDHEVREYTEIEAAAILDSMPTSFDIRDKWTKCKRTFNYIKDQGACGSCWAVSSSSSIEDRMCIALGSGIPDGGVEPADENNVVKVLRDEPMADWEMSEEDIASCCQGRNQGCKGGYPIDAMAYYAKKGVPTGGYYGSYCGCKPYKINPLLRTMQQTPSCSSSCDTPNFPLALAAVRFFASKYYAIRGVAAMQKDIYEHGSIVCGFTVHKSFEDFFKDPKNCDAVYTGPSGFWKKITDKTLGGHAVTVVGWGVQNGVDYWQVKNSWNTTWNCDGEFRIQRGKNKYGFEAQCAAAIPATGNGNAKRIRCAKRDFAFRP